MAPSQSWGVKCLFESSRGREVDTFSVSQKQTLDYVVCQKNSKQKIHEIWLNILQVAKFTNDYIHAP